MIAIIQLIVGLLLLVFGGDYLVKGGVEIARRCQVGSLIIGMTVVAFGTSAPEFLVSLFSAVQGHPEMSLGNVIGSNIFNIALILGITSLILPLAVNRVSVRIDAPFMIVCSVGFMALLYDNEVSRWEGLCMVLLIVAFVLYEIHQSRQENKDQVEAPEMTWSKALLITVAAAVALTFGSNWLIKGASAIALHLGISERVISLTVVALGTSLPELAASMAAAFKKEADIAIGNIIGSNIFNILFVIGMSAVIHPIRHFQFADFQNDLCWMCTIAMALWICILPWKCWVSRKKVTQGTPYSTLGRISGILLCCAILAYTTLLFLKP